MPNYNQNAIEGHIYCWQLQRKPPKFSHAGLLKITGTEVWTLEDIESFYKKIDNGQFTLQGDDAIKGFIYCLYRQRLPFKAAHAKISKVLGCDEVKIEDVREIYQKIENGYDMEIISLEGIMKLMNQKIVNELDLKSRISLRNTSKALRTVIDNGDFTVKKFEIEIGDDDITIVDPKGYRCQVRDNYRFRDVKCDIYENGKYKFARGFYWERAQRGLKPLFCGSMDVRIEELVLKSGNYFPETGFFDGYEPITFSDVLGNWNKQIEVKKLTYLARSNRTAYSMSQFLNNYFNPHKIEELHIGFYLTELFVAREIYGTQHWKNLKTFKSDKSIEYENLGDSYGHINYVSFRLNYQAPTIPQLIELKDKLLQNQNLEAIILSECRLYQNGIEEFNSQFDRIADFKTPFNVVNVTNRKVLSVFVFWNEIAFAGPCCECKVNGRTLSLQGTVSGSREILHRERNDGPMWYHFYY